MDDYLKTDMTEFGLMLKSINPSVEWIAIPPEVKWVDAGCSMNQLSALKYVEVQDVYVLLSIMYPPKKIVITDSSQFWNVEVLVALGREGLHLNVIPVQNAPVFFAVLLASCIKRQKPLFKYFIKKVLHFF